MKRFVYIFIAAAFAICSCDKDKSMQQVEAGGISVSQKEVEIYPGGGNAQILLTSGESWSMTTSNNWVEVNPKGGKAGSTLLTITADVNQDDEDRYAVLTFTNGDGSQKVVVRQNEPYLNVIYDNEHIDYAWEEGFLWYESKANEADSHVLRIESNTWWKITGQNEDFVLNQTEGEGDFTLTVIPNDINVTEDDNKMTLTLEGPDYRKKYTLDFEHDHLVFMINNFSVKKCNELGTEIKGVEVESEVGWHLTDEDNRDGWSVSGETQGNGTAGSPITTKLGDITIRANDSREKKIHRIEFIPEDPVALQREISVVYEVSQDPFIFDVEGNPNPKLQIENHDQKWANDVVLDVCSSADWSVDKKEDWVKINVDTMEGSGSAGGKNSKFQFHLSEQNLGLKDRKGKIILKNGVNALSLEVSVIQERFVFDSSWNADEEPPLKTNPENEDKKYRDFILDTYGPWHIDDCPEWLQFSRIKGESGRNTISFRASEINTDEDDRVHEVKIVSDLHEDQDEPLYRIVKVVQNGFRFDVEPLVLDKSFSPLGGETKFKVTSPTEWTASDNCDWITVTPDKNHSDSEVTATVELNPTKHTRNGEITFINNDVNNGKGKEIVVEVQQAAYEYAVDFAVNDPLKLEPVPVVTSYPVKVTSSGSWSANSDQDWVTLTSSGGNGNGSFNINIGNNTTDAERMAKVTVTNADLPESVNSYSLRIRQAPFVFYAESDDNFKFNALSEGQEYKITYECSAGMKITFPEWINCVDDGQGTITVTADPNTGKDYRDGKIIISNDFTDKEVEFNVYQAQYLFSHNGKSEYKELAYEDVSDIKIQITSTGKWSASSNDDSWLTVSPTSGNGDKQITVTIADNKDTKERTATLTIQCDDNKDRKYQITFSQKGAPKK